jgi:hypothetical protein
MNVDLMVGLDQDMEMGRMVREALGRFDQLQGRHVGGDNQDRGPLRVGSPYDGEEEKNV